MRADKAPLGRRARLRLRTRGLWSTDWSLTVLLIILIGNIFALPLTEFATWGRVAARTILSLVIISGVIATLGDRRILTVAVVLSAGSVSVGWENVKRPNLYFHLSSDLFSLLFVGFLAGLILRQVLRPGPITSRRVQGSVAVYLLLGLLWAIWYELIEFLAPGSFGPLRHKGAASLPELAYFSYTTLTTLGLGGTVPLKALARSLVMLEALVGQLFPVILIAGLVTMEIGHRSRSRQT